MPRPRTFDEAAVIDAAVTAFWQGGLHATSVDELLRATGLARSSLYNSFGSRDELVRLAIERYVDRQIAQLERAFQGQRLDVALEAIFIDIARDNHDGKGCLLINGVNELHDPQADALATIRRGFARVATRLTALVAAARPDAQDPSLIAAEVITAIAGLRTLQRTGLPSATVRETARRFAKRIAQG
jgi:TetR/AcrR family transcriptional repressor of nem operon